MRPSMWVSGQRGHGGRELRDSRRVIWLKALERRGKLQSNREPSQKPAEAGMGLKWDLFNLGRVESKSPRYYCM
jgi:hypothetical protein